MGGLWGRQTPHFVLWRRSLQKGLGMTLSKVFQPLAAKLVGDRGDSLWLGRGEWAASLAIAGFFFFF